MHSGVVSARVQGGFKNAVRVIKARKFKTLKKPVANIVTVLYNVSISRNYLNITCKSGNETGNESTETVVPQRFWRQMVRVQISLTPPNETPSENHSEGVFLRFSLIF